VTPGELITKPIYDVCLSFARAQEGYVERVSQALKLAGVSVFLDSDHQVEMWGADPIDFFHQIYYGSARYCLVFISHEYALSNWTNLERRAAQSHAFGTKQEYILPIRMDDTHLPGPVGAAYSIDGRECSPDQVAELVIQKLNRDIGRTVSGTAEGDTRVPAQASISTQAAASGLVAIETVPTRFLPRLRRRHS
jgi:hypothetical protein